MLDAGSKLKLDRCWSIPDDPPVICQLGRFGDLLCIFPALKLMFEQTGIKPIVMVSNVYASLMDGISYATPWIVPLDWWKDIAKAKRMAYAKTDNVIVPQFWNDLSDQPKKLSGGKIVKFSCHGKTWEVEGDSADFGTAMWNRLGFTRAQMLSEPLVLDRRGKERETALVKSHVRGNRPLLLYNLLGLSSPFGYIPEMMQVLKPYREHFEMLDLSTVRAHRIYDLLGLYDMAVGLITVDTATGHLAPASKVPTLWFTVDHQGCSVPRGNVALHVKYSETSKWLGEIDLLLKLWM